MKSKILLCLILISILLITGFWNYGRASENGIEVCVKGSGAIFMVGEGFERTECLKNEKLVSWNIVGPQGPRGEKGDTGPVGPVGPQGAQGESNIETINELEDRIYLLESKLGIISPRAWENGILTLSLDPLSPIKSSVVCTAGPYENECDGVRVLAFNLKAEQKDINIRNLRIELSKSGGNAEAAYVHLFDGSTELGSAQVAEGQAKGQAILLSDLDYVIPKDVTKVLTVKIDFRNAESESTEFIAGVHSNGITAENTDGGIVTYKTGTAIGNSISITSMEI